MSKSYTLLLKLEGPMQSWGYRSRFEYRDTALEPTRSGVIGLICAAMGIARGEDITRFDEIRMGIRVNIDGRPERDYHTALNIIKADGKISNDAILSYREYLANASFAVGLESENKLILDEIAAAMRNPKWILFLGRKAFPLSVPPLGPSDNPVPGKLEDHLLHDEPDPDKGEGSRRRVMIECPKGEKIQHDWPICFNKRQFKPRNMRTCFTEEGKAK